MSTLDRPRSKRTPSSAEVEALLERVKAGSERVDRALAEFGLAARRLRGAIDEQERRGNS